MLFKKAVGNTTVGDTMLFGNNVVVVSYGNHKLKLIQKLLYCVVKIDFVTL